MILAFSGGVGGAKLVAGLAAVCAPDALMAVVNTGDDFDLLGLRVCPDIDSVLYAAADLHDAQRGWGRRDESWHFHHTLQQLGVDAWFQLGDRDLATHVLRSAWLREGLTLTQVTARLAEAVGLRFAVIPMSDQPVPTLIDTPQGRLAFQDYFVRQRCAPVCTGIVFGDAAAARPPAVLQQALDVGGGGFVFCPSNPFVSIEPILAVPGIRRALLARQQPCVAVSPLIGGQAVKGPAAKMMRELGLQVSTLGIAHRYAGLLDGIVIDTTDRAERYALEALGLKVAVTDTLMPDADDRRRVARATLELLARCSAPAACKEE